MTPFDANTEQEKPFNWYFWLANGLVVIAGALVLYAVVYVHEELEQIDLDHDRFASSVSRYLEYRQLSCSSTQYSDDIFLRKINNTTEPLSAEYIPETLVPIPSQYVHPRVGIQSVRNDIVEPLSLMMQNARNDGLDLRVNSAYRSYRRQDEVYRANTNTVFITKPERAARPGYSEHQLGTAIDVSLYPSNGQAGYDWLRENAYRYGFVLSYPDGAQDVTEFLFEPWHWRYVGEPIAKHIHENNMLFNHEQTLLLPSPLEEGVELPYEYTGRDLWVWKSLGEQSETEILLRGWQEQDFFNDLPLLIDRFDEGVINNIAGSITLSLRDWMITSPSSTYTDRNNEIWVRTSLASPRDNEEIERLEILFQKETGYLIVSYQTQDAGDRLAREFTYTCSSK